MALLLRIIIKIGAPIKEVIMPTGISIGPNLATKSAALRVRPPTKADNGRIYL